MAGAEQSGQSLRELDRERYLTTLYAPPDKREALTALYIFNAEIAAIRDAAKALGNERLDGCELWVTLEPCAMCAGAISHARIVRLYYAASDPKGGAVEHGVRVFEHPQCLHRPEVYSGMGEAEAAELLRAFFQERR